MTATTPIYGLSYPEGSDLVSSAPDSFKAMADTFEQALDQVDRRSTPTGVKPVIATTLNTLAKIHGVTGQTGYVTDDGGKTGMYVWTGTSWLRIVDSPMIKASTTLTKITTDSLYVTAKILDQGIHCIGFDNTALIVAQIEWINNGQFTSAAWTPVDLFNTRRHVKPSDGASTTTRTEPPPTIPHSNAWARPSAGSPEETTR